MRTSTRRLRSNLRLFEPAIEPAWANSLRDELKWLAGLLGDVRDLDVLEENLRADYGAESEDEADGEGAAASLFGRIESKRDDARRALADALEGDRYGKLRSLLITGARDPEPGPDAESPAHKALPKLLDRSWRKFAREAEAIALDSPVEAYHDLRKRAKRVRYAAEAIRLAPSKQLRREARRQARAAADVQEILGRMQDAVVESAFLAGSVEGDPLTEARSRLATIQEEKQRGAREEFVTWRLRLHGES
jgi:CHAD domain-containing protein